jgi:hypothetical protein
MSEIVAPDHILGMVAGGGIESFVELQGREPFSPPGLVHLGQRQLLNGGRVRGGRAGGQEYG